MRLKCVNRCNTSGNMYKAISQKFSEAASVTRTFLVGFKDLTKEVGIWVKLKSRVVQSQNGVKDLNRKEMDLYYRVPKEISRVAPTLVVSALPLANYVMLPIAYYYPRHLLSSHFWNQEQKTEFPVEEVRLRQKYYPPVLRILKERIQYSRNEAPTEEFKLVLHKIESGSQPTCQEILDVQDLFATDIYSLKNLTRAHAELLCRMHDLHPGFFRKRSKLFKTATMIRNLDSVIQTDGLSALKTDELRAACYLRGYDGFNASEEDMRQFVSHWISVTTAAKPSASSLILHLPILLAYTNSRSWNIRV